MLRNKAGIPFSKLKEILAPMTWRERMEYLWEYYKIVFFVLIAVLLVINSIIGIKRMPDVVFNGTAANVVVPDGGESYLTEEWLQEIGGNPEKETVTFNLVMFPSRDELITEEELAYAQKVTSLAAAQMLDYVLLDMNALEYYLGDRIFCSLENVLTQEQLKQFENKLVYLEEGDGTTYPVAVDISDTSFGQACATVDGMVFIGFPGNTERAELSDDFLDYLLKWETKE